MYTDNTAAVVQILALVEEESGVFFNDFFTNRTYAPFKHLPRILIELGSLYVKWCMIEIEETDFQPNSIPLFSYKLNALCT